MKESEFIDQVEEIFMRLEDLLDEFEEDIDQPIPFLILIFIMSYKMASAFMDVYDLSSLAVL